MKTRIFSIVFTVFTTLTFSQTSSLDTEEKLNIDVSKSQIKWSGEYAFYYGGHDGIINFKEGYFIKRNGAITGGTITNYSTKPTRRIDLVIGVSYDANLSQTKDVLAKVVETEEI